MSDEAVELRRTLIRKKQRLVQLQSMSPNPSLTEEQRFLVEQLSEAQKRTFDSNFIHFNNFRPVRRHVDPIDPQHTSSSVFSMLPHISDLVTYVIEGVISFAKIVPHFRSLTIDDQIALLKGGALEMCVLRFNTVFNPKTCSWECGRITYNLRDMVLAGFRQFFLEPLIRFHCMLKKLNLQMEEYALMEAICLFSSDRPGVTNHKAIDQIQEHLAMTLMSYIDCEQRPTECRFLFAKIMVCLTELRTVSDEHSKQVLHVWDIQPGYTPLLLEVFSKISE